MTTDPKEIAKMAAARLAVGKVAARIGVFAVHVAAFGAAFALASESIAISIAAIVLSLVCLGAERVLASHFTSLAGTIGQGIKLRDVLTVWYLFAALFWLFIAVRSAVS